MKKFEVFDLFADELSGIWKVSLFQGALLILLGILILMVPQLLVVMVASFFMVLGVTFLTFAWKSRKFQRYYDKRFRMEIRDLF